MDIFSASAFNALFIFCLKESVKLVGAAPVSIQSTMKRLKMSRLRCSILKYRRLTPTPTHTHTHSHTYTHTLYFKLSSNVT